MPAFPQSTTTTYTAISVPPALSLPVIENDFPRQLHPYWPRLQERTRHWLLEKRLMPAEKVEAYADGLCYTDLMAGYYIGAPDEVLQAIADYSAWFFAWDDRHDRDVIHGRPEAWRRLRRRLHAALDSPRAHLHHRDPLVAGFADSVARLYSFLGEGWNVAVRRPLPRCHRGVRPGIPQPHGRHCPDRRGISRTAPDDVRALDLARPAGAERGVRTAHCRTAESAYRRASLLCQDFAAWYNDLCSLPKEIAGDEVHNLGISLIHHEGMQLEEAVGEVRRRVEECIIEFLHAEQEVLRYADRIDNGSARGAALAEAVRVVSVQYAELVQFRVLVPSRVGPVHGRQLGRPLHAPVRQQRSGR